MNSRLNFRRWKKDPNASNKRDVGQRPNVIQTNECDMKFHIELRDDDVYDLKERPRCV